MTRMTLLITYTTQSLAPRIAGTAAGIEHLCGPDFLVTVGTFVRFRARRSPGTTPPLAKIKTATSKRPHQRFTDELTH